MAKASKYPTPVILGVAADISGVAEGRGPPFYRIPAMALTLHVNAGPRSKTQEGADLLDRYIEQIELGQSLPIMPRVTASGMVTKHENGDLKVMAHQHVRRQFLAKLAASGQPVPPSEPHLHVVLHDAATAYETDFPTYKARIETMKALDADLWSTLQPGQTWPGPPLREDQVDADMPQWMRERFMT